MHTETRYPLTRQATRPRFALPVRTLLWLIAPALLLLVWQGVVLLRLYPEFIIPAPLTVWERFVEVLLDGRLLYHTGVTLGETLGGLAIGAVLGVLLGYLIAKSKTLDALLSPLVVAFQSTPVVAYAPLLVIWFDGDSTSKIITSALIVFFPMLMNTVIGLRGVPQSLRDLMLSLRATRWQMFTRLEVPAALTVLFGGLRVSATLAVVGAVVGEFIVASAGLGFLITEARYRYDTALVIVAVLMLALIARLLYGAVNLLEAQALAWRRSNVR
jgi:NitT/TauT family transport system permease protein